MGGVGGWSCSNLPRVLLGFLPCLSYRLWMWGHHSLGWHSCHARLLPAGEKNIEKNLIKSGILLMLKITQYMELLIPPSPPLSVPPPPPPPDIPAHILLNPPLLGHHEPADASAREPAGGQQRDPRTQRQPGKSRDVAREPSKQR